MSQVFNMGHRFEIYTDVQTAEEILQLADKYQIAAKIVGRCEYADHKKLSIEGDQGEFEY